jgi:hypothetical protein
MLNKVRLSNTMQGLFSFSKSLQFSADAFPFAMRNGHTGWDAAVRVLFSAVHAKHAYMSYPNFFPVISFRFAHPAHPSAVDFTLSRNNNARRNRSRGGSIEESRKRECNVIRTVHCRMMGLYIDTGGWVRGRVARGGGRQENAATRQAGGCAAATLPSSAYPPGHPSPPHCTTKPRDEKTLI